MITLKYIKSVKKVKVHIRGPWMMNRHDFGGPDSSASNTEVDICGSGWNISETIWSTHTFMSPEGRVLFTFNVVLSIKRLNNL